MKVVTMYLVATILQLLHATAAQHVIVATHVVSVMQTLVVAVLLVAHAASPK
jgi:hypothetical protein